MFNRGGQDDLKNKITAAGLEVVMTDLLPPEQADQEAQKIDLAALVNDLIAQAISARASDIHIEPQEDRVLVRFRIDGMLREIMTLPWSLKFPLAARVKIMANLDIVEKRLPQDGRIKIRFAGRDIDLRVSTMATMFGEKVVIRIHDKSVQKHKIDQLGFSAEDLCRYRQLIKNSHGMILITGPTGSGKTTTLYATISELCSQEKNIVTIEDPVEYVLKGVNQTQVNPGAGITFAIGLRAILRQDPDVVMVGEIRDQETASIAVRAATTGQLVLSTMHTIDAPGALTRLIDMGVEPFLISSSVLCIVSQRLVRLCCEFCREAYEPAGDSPERMLLDAENGGAVCLYRSRGCEHCGYTGFKGRTGIFEILPLTAEIRRLVGKKASSDEIRKTATEQGMITFREDGIKKAMMGVTTLSEVMRVTYSDLV